MKYRPSHIIIPVSWDISRNVFHLALPIIFSNLSRVLMNLFDVAMVGYLGANALAAVGMGSIVIWTVLSFGIAIRTGVQTVTSRRLGERRYEGCGAALNNGLIFSTIAGIILSTAGYLLTIPIINFLLDDPGVIPLAVNYTQWAFLSVFFAIVCYAFQGFFNGIERTRIHMQVTITSNILNVYLNAGLIFGSNNLSTLLSDTPLGNLSFFAGLWTPFHFPALGVVGAAVATLFASFWMAVHYSIYGFLREFRVRYRTFQKSFDSDSLKKVIRIAAPQGFQEAGVMLVFVLFFKITAMVGTMEVAATEVVFTIMQTSFLPAMGFGIACATLVGKFLGEGDPDRAEMSMIESVRWSIFFMGTMGIIFILFPDTILPFFTRDQEVIRLGLVALRILGVVQFADAVGMTLWFALCGAGNTKDRYLLLGWEPKPSDSYSIGYRVSEENSWYLCHWWGD